MIIWGNSTTTKEEVVGETEAVAARAVEEEAVPEEHEVAPEDPKSSFNPTDYPASSSPVEPRTPS